MLGNNNRMFVIVFALLVGFSLLVWSSFGGYMSGMMGMMYGWGYMAFLPFAFVGLLIVGAYLFLNELTKSGTASMPALDILNTRYARGDITREQYLRMKDELDM